ncbi:MAG: signal peptide peptidase SppA [Alphaproteobacteria bacterium]|nr:signal peptide peptidase SppA [Alphaproteobacteria bacterium]
MSLETDILMERRRTRRSALLWKVVAALAVTALAAVLVARPMEDLDGLEAAALFDGEHIARVRVEGLIVEDRWRDKMLKDLKDDDTVKAVIVHVNSPGGTVVGGEDLYRLLRDVAAQKPVTTVLGSVAASAGYMTAIGGERIFAREGTLTGSIGVLFQSTEVTGLLEKVGVKAELVKSAELKAQPNPIEPFNEQARAAIKGVVMDMFDMFTDMVAERRGMDRDKVLALADGRIYTGRQALANGLIDAIGGEDAAIAWLESEKDVAADLPIKDKKPKYPRPDYLERVLGSFGKALVSERLTLDGLVSVWQPDL